MENNIKSYLILLLREDKKLLSLVHFDVCGPTEKELLEVNRYFVIFIDDALQNFCVCVLKIEGKEFKHFKRFHALVKKVKWEKKLNFLHTKNGGEYTFNELLQTTLITVSNMRGQCHVVYCIVV